MSREIKIYSKKENVRKGKRSQRDKITLFQKFVRGIISLDTYEKMIKERNARNRRV